MFVKLETTEVQSYDVWDGCYGVIRGRCQKGVFLLLDNGEPAFAYRFTSLWPGTEVLCTVRRLASGDRRTLVTIDSVCYYPAAA